MAILVSLSLLQRMTNFDACCVYDTFSVFVKNKIKFYKFTVVSKLRVENQQPSKISQCCWLLRKPIGGSPDLVFYCWSVSS